MNNEPTKIPSYLEARMRLLPFVQWDRYTFSDATWQVYGWVDREKDSYKDFVVFIYGIEKVGDQQYITFRYVTSSAEHSEEIAELLKMGGKQHAVCKRVEDISKLENVIRL